MPTRAEAEAYVRGAALARGIDPNVAVAVARSEGLTSGDLSNNQNFRSNVKSGGAREPSYGPFQLHTAYMGSDFEQATGLDLTDVDNWQATVDYALDRAANEGWGAWHGAANTGISDFEGLQGARAIGVNAGTPAGVFGGASRTAIENAQRSLQNLGYYTGEIDGLVGPLTTRAIQEYQADMGREGTDIDPQQIVNEYNNPDFRAHQQWANDQFENRQALVDTANTVQMRTDPATGRMSFGFVSPDTGPMGAVLNSFGQVLNNVRGFDSTPIADIGPSRDPGGSLFSTPTPVSRNTFAPAGVTQTLSPGGSTTAAEAISQHLSNSQGAMPLAPPGFLSGLYSQGVDIAAPPATSVNFSGLRGHVPDPTNPDLAVPAAHSIADEGFDMSQGIPLWGPPVVSSLTIEGFDVPKSKEPPKTSVPEVPKGPYPATMSDEEINAEAKRRADLSIAKTISDIEDIVKDPPQDIDIGFIDNIAKSISSAIGGNFGKAGGNYTGPMLSVNPSGTGRGPVARSEQPAGTAFGQPLSKVTNTFGASSLLSPDASMTFGGPGGQGKGG